MFNEVPYQIPDTWTWSSLDELLETLESGLRPKGGVKKYSEGVPSIGGEHLDGKGGFRFDNIRFIPKDYYQNMKRGRIKNLDILVVKDGATTGKTSIVAPDFPFKEAAVNEHVFILRTRREILEPYYLFRFLSSIQGQNQILQRFQGTAQGGINSKFVEGFPIPLPPLNEQRRIVARVEALLAESKTAREALDKVPVLLKRFRQSVLAKAFRGELTQRDPNDEPAQKLLEKLKQGRQNLEAEVGISHRKIKKSKATTPGRNPPELPETWCWSNLGDIVYVAARIGWRGLKKSEYTKDGPILLSIPDILEDRVNLEKTLHISLFRYEESPEIQLRNNDIILAKDGATIGKVGIIECLKEKATVNSSLAVIRCPEGLNPRFLYYYLKSPSFQTLVKEKMTGTAVPHLFQKDLIDFKIPLPPSAEQERILKVIQESFSLAGDIEKAVTHAKAYAAKVDQAILAKAFRGELVPQDPDDEPASVLLERIKSKTKKPTTIQTKLAN